ncbi:hypothetical protein [Polaromonas glacialis]|uniref:hypothetical protein n=1 Tax=Polaromonas glacialis TaxID=866564 RepID=UPI000496FC30|nr:hypothetical protein [Polaromonas glacialis]
MKRLFLVLPLACAALLLSGCPDAKLPTPNPMVPTPKAQEAVRHGLPQTLAGHQPVAAMPVNASHS